MLLLMTHALVSAYNDAAARLPALARRPLSAPEAAHVADHLASCDALHCFVSHAHALLTERRHGGAVAYLEAGAAVVTQMAVIMGAVEANSVSRMARFGHRLAQQAAPSWRNTFFDHAVAAGALPSLPAAVGGGMHALGALQAAH
jgi:hypothetical protein